MEWDISFIYGGKYNGGNQTIYQYDDSYTGL